MKDGEASMKVPRDIADYAASVEIICERDISWEEKWKMLVNCLTEAKASWEQAQREKCAEAAVAWGVKAFEGPTQKTLAESVLNAGKENNNE